MTIPLHVALRIIRPDSGEDSSKRATAWNAINERLHEHWFNKQAPKYGAAELIDDVRQTVLLRLLQGNALFAGQSEGEAVRFIQTTARNATIDTQRRRKHEEALTDEHVEKTGGGTSPDERMRTGALSHRLEEVVIRAMAITKKVKREVLERHVRESVLGQPATDSSIDSDPKEAARLRQERSRALGWLRQAHDELVSEVAQDMNDEIDRVVRAILASPRTRTPETTE